MRKRCASISAFSSVESDASFPARSTPPACEIRPASTLALLSTYERSAAQGLAGHLVQHAVAIEFEGGRAVPLCQPCLDRCCGPGRLFLFRLQRSSQSTCSCTGSTVVPGLSATVLSRPRTLVTLSIFASFSAASPSGPSGHLTSAGTDTLDGLDRLFHAHGVELESVGQPCAGTSSLNGSSQEKYSFACSGQTTPGFLPREQGAQLLEKFLLLAKGRRWK